MFHNRCGFNPKKLCHLLKLALIGDIEQYLNLNPGSFWNLGHSLRWNVDSESEFNDAVMSVMPNQKARHSYWQTIFTWCFEVGSQKNRLLPKPNQEAAICLFLLKWDDRSNDWDTTSVVKSPHVTSFKSTKMDSVKAVSRKKKYGSQCDHIHFILKNRQLNINLQR